MNCPSRNDETSKHPHWNQAPPALTADLTTRADLNGIANIRERDDAIDTRRLEEHEDRCTRDAGLPRPDNPPSAAQTMEPEKHASPKSPNTQQQSPSRSTLLDDVSRRVRRIQEILIKYAQFIGPGFLIAVAYIDPGNYATDVNGML